MINYKYLYDKGLTNEDYHTLIQIIQKEHVLLEGKDFSKFIDLKLVEFVKTSGKENERVRISKGGKTFIQNCSEQDFTDDIGDLIEFLVELYQEQNKQVGNPLEIRSRIVWFIKESGFNTNVIKSVVIEYLQDNSKFTLSLENLIWKPASIAFSIHMNLKNSKLFTLITEKYNLPITFFVKDKYNRQESWIFEMCKLKIPKNMNSEYYWTGSYQTDVEIQNKFKILFKKLL